MAISPPSPVAANDGDGNPPPGGCDSLVDCLTDTVPVPPGPCGIIQIESCRCLTQVGACGIEVPDPCDVGDCGCVGLPHVNSDDLRVCGFSVNPCDWLQGSKNLCACVNVPTTTTFGRAPSGSGSCGIALPGPGGQPPGPVPNPCDGLPADTCECISISNTIPGVALSAVPDYVCGLPTNPCALVGTGTLADGCGCVEMNGPQRLSLAGLLAATTVTSTGIIPTSICGIPTDPCALAAVACECVAQIEREVLQGGGGGETPAILAFQRVVTPPAFCVPLPDPCSLVLNQGVPTNGALPMPNYVVNQPWVNDPQPSATTVSNWFLGIEYWGTENQPCGPERQRWYPLGPAIPVGTALTGGVYFDVTWSPSDHLQAAASCEFHDHGFDHWHYTAGVALTVTGGTYDGNTQNEFRARMPMTISHSASRTTNGTVASVPNTGQPLCENEARLDYWRIRSELWSEFMDYVNSLSSLPASAELGYVLNGSGNGYLVTIPSSGQTCLRVADIGNTFGFVAANFDYHGVNREVAGKYRITVLGKGESVGVQVPPCL